MGELGRLGLVLHPSRDVGEATDVVVDWAARRGVTVCVDERDRARVASAVPVPAGLLTTCDALVSIGGDGTMLGALRLVADDPRPVLGVNMGRLGFLVEIELPELRGALDRLADGDVTVERHSCLRVTIGDQARVAFNDLALSRSPGESTVNAILTIDGQQYGYYRADAVIMATPTGSTAHSYSAGGPLLSPSTDAVVITPVAPMSGISRPLVLAAGEHVEFGLLPDPGPNAHGYRGLLRGDVPADDLRGGEQIDGSTGGLRAGGNGSGGGLHTSGGGPAGGDRTSGGLRDGGYDEGAGFPDEEHAGRPAVETDGQVVDHLEPGRTVRAELRPDAGLVVRLDVRTHRQRSQAKLSLLDLPLLPDQMRELLPPHVRDQLARRELP
ncbi:MAG TPA: NAD(+)/NADH kinase [Actinocatenispora sp.]